jgi:hypothetical protein
MRQANEASAFKPQCAFLPALSMCQSNKLNSGAKAGSKKVTPAVKTSANQRDDPASAGSSLLYFG